MGASNASQYFGERKSHWLTLRTLGGGTRNHSEALRTPQKTCQNFAKLLQAQQKYDKI